MTDQRLRLADLLAALSVATDLGMGQQPERAIRSCLVATGLARAMDLPDHAVRDVYYASLVRHLGCTATASTEARIYGGDELVSRPAAESSDFGSPREMLGLTLGTGRHAGLRRPVLLARAVVGNVRHGETILRSVCEAGSLLAGRLGLSDGVRSSLVQVFERWDGGGSPAGLAGEEIALSARIGDIANQAVLASAVLGPDAAADMVRQRAGGWFDPGVAEVFRRVGVTLLRDSEASDPWVEVLAAEPHPARHITQVELDDVARCFADMVDLKSTCTFGHSTEVARIARDAARSLHLHEREVDDLHRAALLHDLGRIGVSSGIWDKPGPLTRGEREQMRLHPYHTERILACSPALETLGPIAGMHHERLDGSGYHHGLSAPAIPFPARILAAADAFQTATQRRPHGPALRPEQAVDRVIAEADEGRLDPDCVRAVVEAAGQPRHRIRPSWPAGLSDREVEVVRLVARGLTNREIARRLVISPRTAEHHVQHVYVKVGCSTRAALSLFAMEHDLLRH